MRLTSITLDGFKGIHSTYDLDIATALHGPMGAGKSACLEGIRYALTGEVPGGKKDDVIATYFGPDGGTVTVTDSDGRWIRRGIRIDRKKGLKVERILDTSDTPDGAKQPDTTAWDSAPVVLDIGQFLGLSAEKRRQFVLRLCGSTDDSSALLPTIALQYARDVGGKAATLELLDAESLPGFEDDEAARVRSWHAHGGLREVLEAEMAGAELSVADAAGRLIERAGRELSYHRKAARDGRAAAAELEARAMEARPIAEGLTGVRRRLDVARSLHAAEVEAQTRIEVADLAVERARKRVGAAMAALETAQARLDGMEDPGPEPVLADPESTSSIDEVVSDATKDIESVRSRLQRLRDAQRDYVAAASALKSAESALDNHRQGDVGFLVESWEAMKSALPTSWTGSDGGLIDRMDAAVRGVSVGWSQGLEKRLADVEKAISTKTATESILNTIGDHEPDLIAQEARIEEKLLEFAAERREIVEKNREELAAYRDAHYAWRGRNDASLRAKDAITRAQGEMAEAERASKAAEDARAQLGSEVPDPDQTSADVAALELQVEAAQTAAGIVRTLDETIASARRSEIFEGAWSTVSRSIKTARESLVADAARPLVEEMVDLLPEGVEPFLALEDDRGSPTFAMGLILSGGRVAIGPLSDGWSTLFLAALSVVIARRSKGRKVLAVEADHLDERGILAAMELLAPCASELDALLLATSRPIPNVDGWSVFGIESGGKQVRR